MPGTTFSVPTTSVGPRLSPLAPLAPSSLPTTCGGNFWGVHHLCRVGLLPLLPTCSPHSLTPSLLPSLLACSLSLPLLPAHSQLAPLAPNGQGRLGVCCTMFWIPTTSVGARISGVRWSELGARGSELGARGSKGSKRE